MSGRSALEEVMAGSADTVRLAEELKEMEAAMCDPQLDDMDALLERYGATQEEFEHRGGYDLNVDEGQTFILDRLMKPYH